MNMIENLFKYKDKYEKKSFLPWLETPNPITQSLKLPAPKSVTKVCSLHLYTYTHHLPVLTRDMFYDIGSKGWLLVLFQPKDKTRPTSNNVSIEAPRPS